MTKLKIPELMNVEVVEFLKKAEGVEKRRYPKLLHKPGDYFNHVFNFMMKDSYMQPHLHPGSEKIEKIYIVKGKVAVIFFDDIGIPTRTTILDINYEDQIEVPAYTWHTYIILTESAVTYETMMGIYDSETWKKFADWAPKEGGLESTKYLEFLRKNLND